MSASAIGTVGRKQSETMLTSVKRIASLPKKKAKGEITGRSVANKEKCLQIHVFLPYFL